MYLFYLLGQNYQLRSLIFSPPELIKISPRICCALRFTQKYHFWAESPKAL